jgi:hypothetical protein
LAAQQADMAGLEEGQARAATALSIFKRPGDLVRDTFDR